MRRTGITQPGDPEIPTRDGRRPARGVWALGLGIFLVLLLTVGSASAAVITPSKFEDSADGDCDADCSLREAIIAANGNGVADEIWLDAGVYTLTIAGSGETDGETGDLNIKDDLRLLGQGPEQTIIDATGLGDRVFRVNATGALVEFEALTVTGGAAPLSGGGIHHYVGTLELSNVVVRDNTTTGAGGGIHSYLAELTVQDGSVIRDNSAGGSGGGLTGHDLTVTDSTVWGNQAASGGGISTGGSLTVSGSTIAYNTTVGFDGGGIKAETAQVELSNTTLAGNYSGRKAGAVHALGGTTVTLNGVTIRGNSSPSGESLQAASSATFTLVNTLIVGTCYADSGGAFVSSNGNLESPGDTCDLAAGTDQIGVGDPMLFPLDSYGGPTQTMLPRLGSPALGGGDDGYCLTYDQRGELRSDGNCDVGAVERQSVEPDPIFTDGFESGDTSAWTG